MAKIYGLDGLKTNIEAIKYETRYKGGRHALRKAAQLVRDAAKANASRINDPTTTEDISKNISERWNARSYKQNGDLAFRVGVLGGAKNYAGNAKNVRSGRAGKSYGTGGSSANPGGNTWYWRFPEFGTEKMAATPFMRPALEGNIDRAITVFVSEYNKSIDRAIKKGGKK